MFEYSQVYKKASPSKITRDLMPSIKVYGYAQFILQSSRLNNFMNRMRKPKVKIQY